nr:putative RNA-directed DNA polymerase [Tanacetum cinerariifolium]
MGVVAARDGEWGEGSSRSGGGEHFWVRRKRSLEKFSGGGCMVAAGRRWWWPAVGWGGGGETSGCAAKQHRSNPQEDLKAITTRSGITLVGPFVLSPPSFSPKETLHAYFAAEGIQHQTSVARTPEQNGVVERRNR